MDIVGGADDERVVRVDGERRRVEDGRREEKRTCKLAVDPAPTPVVSASVRAVLEGSHEGT